MSRKVYGNFKNSDINPCIEESNLSMQCLENELYQHANCKAFFENYRNCKKFWGQICRSRKYEGISPAMPTKEERDKIMELRKKGIPAISSENHT